MPPAARLVAQLAVVATALVASAILPTRGDAQMRVQLPDRIVALDGAGYAKGDPKAITWIVEFADFGCGYCEKFWRETTPALDSAFIRRGKTYWRFVPFTIGMFPNSPHAAIGSICAAEQGKFFEMHDILYDRRKEWMKAPDPKGQVGRYAAFVRLDMRKFDECVKSPRAAKQLEANNAMAQTLRIRGTPTFFINGEVVPGALPTDVFVQGMKAVVADAEKRGGRR